MVLDRALCCFPFIRVLVFFREYRVEKVVNAIN